MSGGPSRQRVLIIVPAWNEQDAITGTIREIRAVVPDADLLVIDDGSVDRTAQRAREAGATVCPLPFNLGVGGAMRTGYRYALRHGYDAAVQIDADGQHDPRYLARLLERLDGPDKADVVIGARFATPDDPYKVRGPRRWAMVLLAWVLSRLAHTRLTDVTSGFRVSNRRAISVFATHYPAEYLGDTVESLVIAARAGLRRSRRSRSPCAPAWPGAPRTPRSRPPSTSSAPSWRCCSRWCATGPPSSRRAPRGGARRHRDRGGRPMSGVTILGLAGSVLILLALFEMMRRHRLREKYALIWALVALAIVTVAAFPALLIRVVGGHRPRGAGQPALLRRLDGDHGADAPAQLRARPARGAHPHPGRGDRAAAPRDRRAPPTPRRRTPRRAAPTSAASERAGPRAAGGLRPVLGRPRAALRHGRERQGADRPRVDRGRGRRLLPRPVASPSTSPPRPTRGSATSATRPTSASPTTTSAAATWRRGELMMFMGCDDLMHPTFVETVQGRPPRVPGRGDHPGRRTRHRRARRTDRPADRQGQAGRAGTHRRSAPSSAARRSRPACCAAPGTTGRRWSSAPSGCGPTPFRDGLPIIQDLALLIDMTVAGETLVVDPTVCFSYRRHTQSASATSLLHGNRFSDERRYYASAAEQSRRTWLDPRRADRADPLDLTAARRDAAAHRCASSRAHRRTLPARARAGALTPPSGTWRARSGRPRGSRERRAPS